VIRRGFKIAILMLILVAEIGLMCISLTFQHEFRNISTQTDWTSTRRLLVSQVGRQRARACRCWCACLAERKTIPTFHQPDW